MGSRAVLQQYALCHAELRINIYMTRSSLHNPGMFGLFRLSSFLNRNYKSLDQNNQESKGSTIHQ
jgi:hypothetical protein